MTEPVLPDPWTRVRYSASSLALVRVSSVRAGASPWAATLSTASTPSSKSPSFPFTKKRRPKKGSGKVTEPTPLALVVTLNCTERRVLAIFLLLGQGVYAHLVCLLNKWIGVAGLCIYIGLVPQRGGHAAFFGFPRYP